MRGKDLTGRRFGRLVAIKRISSDKKGVKWLCRCDCGNETTAYTNKLISGAKSSCGCLHREISRKKASVLAKFDKIDNTRVSYWKKDKPQKNGSTGIRGVNKYAGTRYIAILKFKKTSHREGPFDTLEEAAAARKRLEEKYIKPFLKEIET